MIITINGKPCSGKSTMAKIMAEKYGFKRIGVGDIFKEEAKKRNMSIEEFTELRVKDPTFDLFIDKETSRLGKELANQNVIFDSRMAWHFVPNSFKVYIDLNEDEMVNRLVAREGIEKYKSLTNAKQAVINRNKNEIEIYKKNYGVDCTDLNNYNLVIDSFGKTPEQIADEVWQSLIDFQNKSIKK